MLLCSPVLQTILRTTWSLSGLFVTHVITVECSWWIFIIIRTLLEEWYVAHMLLSVYRCSNMQLHDIVACVYTVIRLYYHILYDIVCSCSTGVHLEFLCLIRWVFGCLFSNSVALFDSDSNPAWAKLSLSIMLQTCLLAHVDQWHARFFITVWLKHNQTHSNMSKCDLLMVVLISVLTLTTNILFWVFLAKELSHQPPYWSS